MKYFLIVVVFCITSFFSFAQDFGIKKEKDKIEAERVQLTYRGGILGMKKEFWVNDKLSTQREFTKVLESNNRQAARDFTKGVNIVRIGTGLWIGGAVLTIVAIAIPLSSGDDGSISGIINVFTRAGNFYFKSAFYGIGITTSLVGIIVAVTGSNKAQRSVNFVLNGYSFNLGIQDSGLVGIAYNF